jgi:hypothetical protein
MINNHNPLQQEQVVVQIMVNQRAKTMGVELQQRAVTQRRW